MNRDVIPLERIMLHGDEATLQAAVGVAQAKVKQMGLWAPNHPVEFGGLGLSMVDHGLFAEAVGRSPLGMTVFGTQAPDAGNIEILHKWGSDEQRTPGSGLGRRKDPELFLHDGAGDGRVEPDAARNTCRRRR